MTASSERIEALIADMTPEEKAGQLTQFFYFGDAAGAAEAENMGGADDLASQPRMVEEQLGRGLVGSLLFVRDAPGINRLQRMTIEGNRHGIPAIFGFDVIHGLRTILPVPIALAASWDPDTIERGQAVAAAEARAVGLHWTFAPMVDIARDPRWGRIIEGAGEDPYLGAAVAAAQVRGFQGADRSGLRSQDRIIAGPKHFAGYGYSAGGRDYDEAEISDATLRNVVLPPFKAAIDAGAGNVMTAYMDLNGIPATGNDWLFRDVLRGEWGFDGFVVSDAMAVHNLGTRGFARDLTEAGARALHAGCDLEMAIQDPAYGHLVEALDRGLVTQDELDESVRRVLRAKEALGLFDDPYVDEERAAAVIADPAHRQVAREAAERTAVLLRNEGSVLPLDPAGTKNVAVLGALASSRRDTLGPWCFDFDLNETVTVLDGIRNRLEGTGARVSYAPGVGASLRQTASIFDVWGDNIPLDPDDFGDADAELDRAVALAAESDVAIVVVGEWQNMIGEQASRSTLDLPGRQLELLRRVVETGTPTVAVLMNGRPLDLRWANEHVPAILDVWYPGTSGGDAVARLLFGDVVPAGRLPFTWPRSVGQVPITYSHAIGHDPAHQAERYWDEESTPLFPFGFGLSYAQFAYGEVELSATSIAPGESLSASVEVRNVSDVDADEVVQLYVHQRWGRSSRPVRLLKGFARVNVPAGATQRVEFTVGPDELRYWNAALRDWVLDPAEYVLGIGGDSTVPLTAEFTVTD